MRSAFVFLLLFSCYFISAQKIEKRNYSAKTAKDLNITINGVFDEPEWQAANWENDFIQHEPIEGDPPFQQTEFAILYDANNLYVAIRAYDTSPDSISMRMTRRDEIDGDLVGIFIDSYYDKRTSFGFIVSAAGVRSDFINSNDGDSEDDTWDPIWWVKTTITKQGWNSEIRIPLTQLRFEESEEQLWGLQVLRYIFRKDELSSWQLMSRETAGFTSQFGTINGIKNIKPKNSLNLTPYVVARTERFEKEPDNPFRSSGKKNGLEAGLDAKIGLTNYLTMDLTINPDFGQVEADPSQVNLSTYETFFEEKRPFFIEGKNILSYGLMFGDGDMASNNLFYSRRIGRRPHYSPDLNDGEYADIPDFTKIIGAAKVTGKTKNGWSVGVLESVTAEENAEIRGIGDGQEQSVEPFTNYFVSRVQKDFSEGNTYVGGMITAVNRNINDEYLEYLHKSAYSGGIDFVHKWNDKNWLLDAGIYFSQVNGTEEALLQTQTSYSRTYQRPDADYLTLDSSRTSLGGHGGKFTIGKVGGKFKIAGIFSWQSPGLEINDIGYTPEVDNMMQILWAGYRWYEPFSIFRSANININQWLQFDFGGHLTAPGGNINGNAQFKNYWRAFGSYNISGEQISNSALRGGPSLKLPGGTNMHFGFMTNQQKKLTFEGNGGVYFSKEKNYRNTQRINLSVAYRPIKALKIDLSPGFYIENSELQYVSQNDYREDTRYIFGKIDRKTLNMSIRINYNISPDLTIQYWCQPFIATGDYSDYKHITNSKADNFNDRYNLYTDGQISYNADSEAYFIDDNLDGTVDYNFDKPDFNVKEFLSNLVVRWEYQPGSTIYLVWNQTRNEYINDGTFDLSNNVNDLFDVKGKNIFLLKFSYRIGR